MKIAISTIGKIKQSPEKELIDKYSNRIPWKLKIKEYEIKKTLNSEQLKEAEGKVLLESLEKGSFVISLDEQGKLLSSKEFAALLVQDTHFIIGGAFGLSEEVRKKSKVTFSLGKITFPHMLARAILVEQIYRAYTIQKKHPYHK